MRGSGYVLSGYAANSWRSVARLAVPKQHQGHRQVAVAEFAIRYGSGCKPTAAVSELLRVVGARA